MAASTKSVGFVLLPPVPAEVTSAEGRAIAEWVRVAWEAQVRRLNNPSDVRFVVLTREPERPRRGQLVYADGTEWDPGSGEGVYAYNGTVWVPLF